MSPHNRARASSNVISSGQSEVHAFNPCRDGRPAQPPAIATVDWLIKLARLIFEPLGTSSLYTFTTETVEWWLDKEMEPSLWRKVEHGE